MKTISCREIANAIENNIVKNQLQPGVRIPNSNQLAKQYNVSAKTADRAITSLVKKNLLTRIRGNGTFVKNNRSSHDQPRIAFFYWRQTFESAVLNHAIYDSFNNAIIKELTKHGFDVTYFEDDTYDKKNSHIFAIQPLVYDIIIVPAGMLEVYEEQFFKLKTEILLYNDDIVHPGPWHQVVYDYTLGFMKALEFARKKGYYKYIFIGANNGCITSKRRINACLNAASKLNIPKENIKVYYSDFVVIDSQIMAGAAAADYVVENKLLNNAIIVMGDFIAYGMIEKFAHINLNLGIDYHLISYDNSEDRINDSGYKLGITGINHPLETSIDAIVDLVENITRIKQNGKIYQTYFVPAQDLVIRKSFK